MIYEWDPEKAKSNLNKQGISFEEAITVFRDPLAETYPDPDHSEEEIREITIGHSEKGKVIFVSHIQRNKRTRVIGARKATPSERKQYEESIS